MGMEDKHNPLFDPSVAEPGGLYCCYLKGNKEYIPTFLSHLEGKKLKKKTELFEK